MPAKSSPSRSGLDRLHPALADEIRQELRQELRKLEAIEARIARIERHLSIVGNGAASTVDRRVEGGEDAC